MTTKISAPFIFRVLITYPSILLSLEISQHPTSVYFYLVKPNLILFFILQARLWVQVIRELRNGVKLKKVDYSRTPIEFELTPYEILMDDIRSRRYKLNKVMVDGDIPHKVKKDAHAIILEFIRSRPPLRKVKKIFLFSI